MGSRRGRENWVTEVMMAVGYGERFIGFRARGVVTLICVKIVNQS